MKYLIVFVQQDGKQKVDVKDLDAEEVALVPRLMAHNHSRLLIFMTIEEWGQTLPQILTVLKSISEAPTSVRGVEDDLPPFRD